MSTQTKEVANPGLSNPNFTRDKFVKRWVSWSKDFIKIAGSMDRAMKFEEEVKQLAERAFDED